MRSKGSERSIICGRWRRLGDVVSIMRSAARQGVQQMNGAQGADKYREEIMMTVGLPPLSYL